MKNIFRYFVIAAIFSGFAACTDPVDEPDTVQILLEADKDALVADGADGEPRFEAIGEGLERRLSVKAIRTDYAGWGTMSAAAPARAVDPPPSPVPPAALGKVEQIELSPLALTQLRITLFPWIR